MLRSPHRDHRDAGVVDDERIVVLPFTNPSAASPTATPLRRSTDAPARAATRPVKRNGYRSILALLDAFTPLPVEPVASFSVGSWAGRGGLLATLMPLMEREAPVSLLLLHAEPPFALREACGLGVADEFHLGIMTTLRSILRRTDLVLRLADRDIAVVLPRCAAPGAVTVARRIADALEQATVQTTAGELAVAVTLGAATASGPGGEAAGLLQQAEDALQARMASGKDQQVPRSSLRAVAREIIAAHDDARLVLALQPIVSATSRDIFCHEALTRLRRDDGSVLSPAAIMPVAELTGLITRIDGRALELAVARLAAHPHQHLSVNVSMRSALDPAWLGLATELLARNRPVAERLIIEITESAAIDDLPATCALLARLKSFGLRIAMDDFGAGHSSFRNLRQLGVDILKIDGAFVRDLGRSADDGVFVRTLIDLARHLGIATVAEYVEDEATAATLTGWGVDYLQGHLIGRAEIA